MRLSAVGDGIHALPVLNALREMYPDAFIGWAAHEALASLLRGHPQLDALHVVPRRPRGSILARLGEWRAAVREIRDCRYDTVVDMQGLAKSGLVALSSGARRRIGFGGEDSREFNGVFMNVRVRPYLRGKHIVERNLELLEPLGIARPAVKFVFAEFVEEGCRMAAFLEKAGALPRFAAMNPGAGWATKRWPPENFGYLAALLKSELSMKTVLTWAGDSEKAMCEKAVEASDGAATIAPATSLRELKELLSRAALFVAGDTGPLHLAAALGVPSVGIYGPSCEERNGPYGRRVRVVAADIACRPCWKSFCRRKDTACMTSVRAEEVMGAVREVLG